MLLEYFNQLDEYRKGVTDHLDRKVIKKKQEELKKWVRMNSGK